MPTLVLARHAKAEHPTSGHDIDRPLLPTGPADAQALGQWLAEQVGRPGLLVVSPAARTLQTADAILRAWPDQPPALVVDEAIYDASLGDLLRVVRGLDDDEDTILLVGHNPGMSQLASELSGQALELPTACAVVLDVPSPWADTPAVSCPLRVRRT